jgi:hypothetical protein
MQSFTDFREVTLSPSSGFAEDGDRVHIFTRLSDRVNFILSLSLIRGVAAVAYPGILFGEGGGSTNSVEDRENGDLGAVAS